MDNQQIRRTIRSQRIALDAESRHQAAISVSERIAATPVFQRSRHLACYLPNDGELDLTPLIEHAWQLNKHVYLPVLAEPNTKRLWFIEFRPDDRLYPNRFGIPEPEHAYKQRLRKTISLDVLYMPLVAFDPQGNRLGMGGGFYDRTLAFLLHRQHWHKPRLWGVAYQFQCQSQIKHNPWDVPLQAIVTEQNLYQVQR